MSTEETKDTAIATRKNTPEALQVFEGAKEGDSRGKESIDSGDVTLPFLAIAQKTSPQIDEGNAKQIAGLKFLQMFNSLTTENYGEGPIFFIPIGLKKHAIEFHPFDDGGGIKDRNVPWDDERCEFNDATGEKPIATRFYDWAVLLVPSMELVVLSMKSTNISVAKQFQQIVQLRQGPAFAGKYSLSTVKATVNDKPFGKFRIAAAGKPTQEEYDFAEMIWTSFQGRTFTTDHEAAAAAEGEGRQPGADDVAEGEVVEQAAPKSGKVPF
jgi:hypothetical protein